ncbi:uncharacterized protein PG986_001801 [Apiospora aurea]|uniref:NADH-cytochrome b5 reductase 2 n=1 Tax=Apiospora aurea TaxID=335848 RepID=A0ABR1QY07_9PEZI
MFARSAFRAAQPLKHNLLSRSYATEPAKGGSNPLLYAAGAAAVGGAAYYFTATPSGKSAAHKAEKEVKSVANATPKVAFTGGDQGFVSLVLEDSEVINHNTKKLRFKLPEDDMVSGLHIASAILTKFKNEGMEKPVLRPYTPTSDEGLHGAHHQEVPQRSHVHTSPRHGAWPAIGHQGTPSQVPWESNKHNHIALIAGGTGITPMYQLCRAIFNNPNDKTKVTLVYGSLTEEDILLKKELEKLENTYPQRFRAFYVLDNPPKEWVGGKGHIDKNLLKTVLPEPKEENIKVFVCGPPGMYKAISGPKVSPKDQGELTGILKDLGYTKDQVYKF